MDINGTLKTYTLAFLLACFLVAIHSETKIRTVALDDCGDNRWRLYDGQEVSNDNETEIIANIILGTNSSTVYEVHIVLPHCEEDVKCTNSSQPHVAVKDVDCRDKNLTPETEELCKSAEAIKALERMRSSVSRWRENGFFGDICFSYYDETISEE